MNQGKYFLLRIYNILLCRVSEYFYGKFKAVNYEVHCAWHHCVYSCFFHVYLRSVFLAVYISIIFNSEQRKHQQRLQAINIAPFKFTSNVLCYVANFMQYSTAVKKVKVAILINNLRNEKYNNMLITMVNG